MKETIKKLREKNNYSQNSIASYLGISRQMYIKYEQGTIEPPVKVVKNLANFYVVSYEYIIDNKLALVADDILVFKDGRDNNKENNSYITHKMEDGNISEPVPAYSQTLESDYFSNIMNMLPKLIYSEQLQVLSKLCDMVKNHAEKEEKNGPSKKMQAFQRILELNEELHLKSDGKKWTREELYDRKIFTDDRWTK